MTAISKDDVFRGMVEKLERHLASNDITEARAILSQIPLDVFAALTCTDELASFPAASAYFPKMPAEQFQRNWVGSSGISLLQQSIAFVRACVREYETRSGWKIDDAAILDYGVGWGRLLRLFNKYVPDDRLFGVDAWEPVLKVAKSLGVRGQLAQVASIPEQLPFNLKFDLIFAFSIFTHLSPRSASAVAKVCADSLSADGLIVFTIRPVSAFDPVHQPEIVTGYKRSGFGFEPSKDVAPIDGDIPYGRAAISLEYIQDNWPWLRIAGLEYNLIDPHQILVLLRRA
jgi:hypothetical protein